VLVRSDADALSRRGSHPSELVEELDRLGYATYVIEPGRLVRVGADQPQPQMVADYLAVKQLPPELDGWRVDQSLALQDQLGRLLVDCTSPDELRRAHAASVLAGVDADVLADPSVRVALDSLIEDPSETVRKAASWWPSPKGDVRP
jgi:hypothetical protein